MPRPSCPRSSTSTPRPAVEIRARDSCSWGPQSQRSEPITSPVTHSEWTRVSTGSSPVTSPATSTRCSAVPSRTARARKAPWAEGSGTASVNSSGVGSGAAMGPADGADGLVDVTDGLAAGAAAASSDSVAVTGSWAAPAASPISRRCAARSSMEIMARPCWSAKARSAGPRCMVPSSWTSSTIIPTAGRPAIRVRSTAASVWPRRSSTPPAFARSGSTCPGRIRSVGTEPGSARTVRVRARSAAEMPVVTPSAASTVKVYAVRKGSALSATISGSSRASARSALIGAHSSPLECLTAKATWAGVAVAAARIRSPSFSRSSSSTTTPGRPAAISSIAAGTGSRRRPVIVPAPSRSRPPGRARAADRR